MSYDLVRTWTAQVGQGGGTETHSGRMTMNNNVLINSKFITINDQIPKLKVKDFLNGLFRKYNLIARLDYQGELVVETLDTYYEGGQTHDITEFVETDQNTVGDAIPFSEVRF